MPNPFCHIELNTDDPDKAISFYEKIFGWHGMGEYFVDSVTKNDVNSVAAVTLFVAVLVLIAGFLSDVAYALLDPRVRV